MTTEENISLAPYTTYGIGGTARYFARAETAGEVKEALAFAQEHGLPHMVLGGGSNVLLSDGGYHGLVIHIADKAIDVQGNIIRMGAGAVWDDVVNAALEHGLAGIEWGAGIPGHAGGAIRGNAGAFGGELKDVIESVEAIVPHRAHQILSNKDCAFSYRNSVFKEQGGIILSATLRLAPGNKRELKKRAKELRTWRQERHPLEYGNCGSVFKRVNLQDIKMGLWTEYPDMKQAVRDGQVATAYFIDKCGLKNTRIGGAEISDKHPNFIVNKTGSATAQNVIMLASLARSRVHQKFGVILEEEPQFMV